jgi:hypothetical protein
MIHKYTGTGYEETFEEERDNDVSQIAIAILIRVDTGCQVSVRVSIM